MDILEHKLIYRDGEYVAFPNLERLSDGTIICAFRHAKERQKEYGKVTHVDPTAKDVFIVSRDEGQTFEKEMHVIADEENISNQDPCVKVLSNGRIIVTFFRWILLPIGQGEKTWGEKFKAFGRTLHNKYDCLSGGIRYCISDDNGKTWRMMGKVSVEGYELESAVRGNIIEMPGGELLMPYYGSKRIGELSRAGLLRSDDKGESWYFYSEMAFDETGKKNYLEPGLFLTDSGRLLALFRTQSDFHKAGVDFDDTYLNLHMAASDDFGKTFGPVYEVKTLWGSSPFHALKLKSGKVLVTYGWRKAPFGIRARLCNGELSDIAEAEEIILRDDAPDGDLGYPHSIQLEDGSILVSYYIDGEDGIRRIEATRLKE